jgi:hypothetical protein
MLHGFSSGRCCCSINCCGVEDRRRCGAPVRVASSRRRVLGVAKPDVEVLRAVALPNLSLPLLLVLSLSF